MERNQTPVQKFFTLGFRLFLKRVGYDPRGVSSVDKSIMSDQYRPRVNYVIGPDGSLLECVDGGLGMVLNVFEDGGALVFESRRFFLRLAGLRVPLPSLFTPGRCRVTAQGRNGSGRHGDHTKHGGPPEPVSRWP